MLPFPIETPYIFTYKYGGTCTWDIWIQVHFLARTKGVYPAIVEYSRNLWRQYVVTNRPSNG
jgi:hypothetical protein